MSGQPARRRRIETEQVGNVTVARFADRRVLREEAIIESGDDLFRLVDELGSRKVVLDFGTVEFMSSAMLGKIITLYRKVQTVGGKLVMCWISNDILDIFKLVKLDRLFTIAGPGFATTDAVIAEFFGNPHRPATFPPEWCTDTVALLAKQIHEVREFSAMPILADALQDAGCDNEDILNHCRDPKQVHVHNCWVLELVLGKK